MGAVRELFLVLLAASAAVQGATLGGAFGNDVVTHRRDAGPHIASPCPEVLLSITNNNKTNRWYGVISFVAEEAIEGIDLSIRLDKRAELLGTWLGEVFTDDKIYFSVIDDRMKILPGEIFALRFFVKYDPSEAAPPSVKTISLNGKQICPQNKEPLELRNSAGSNHASFVTSETTHSIIIGHGSSLLPRLTTPTIGTTQSPRKSRGGLSQNQRIQLNSNVASSELISLLRSLSRVRNEPGDPPLAFKAIRTGSFASKGEDDSKVSGSENLEGLLNTLVRLLMTVHDRALRPDVPHIHEVEETEYGGDVSAHPPLTLALPETQEPTAPAATAADPETNRVPDKIGTESERGPFDPKDPDSYYDEGEYGDEGFALFVSDPTPSPEEIQEPTTTVPTSPLVETGRDSSQVGRTETELNAVPGDPEVQGVVEEDAVEVTPRISSETDRNATRFVSEPTETPLLLETLAFTTLAPTTVDEGFNTVSAEAERVEGEVDPPKLNTPCPGVFSYFSHLAGDDVWYGNITLTSDEDLVGLRVDLELDKRAQGLGALLGKVTTKDNIHFTVWNGTAKIDPGESIYVYFFVKYDPEDTSPPLIKTIRLNGMQICSTSKDTPVEITTPSTTAQDVTFTNLPSPATIAPIDSGRQNGQVQAEKSTPSSGPSASLLPVAGKRRPLPGDRITFKTTASIKQHEVYQPIDTTMTISRGGNRVEHTSELAPHQEPTYTTEATTTAQMVETTEPVMPSTSVSHTYDATNPPSTDATNVETTVNFESTDAPSREGEKKNSVEDDPDISERFEQPIDAHNTTATEHGILGDDDVTCGEREIGNTFVQNRVKEWWPWQAAIYEIRDDNLYYICGGTIVGKRTILTAARCLSNGEDEEPLSPKSLAVYVGKYSLSRWDEAVQYREVKEIHIHPDFDWKNIHGDIAALVLSNPVEVSAFVQPVCLGEQREKSEDMEEGVVVGWGFDRHGNVSDELTVSKMPLLTMRTCSTRYPKLLNYALSDRIYCAGYRSRTIICSGEMGDGMYFATQPDHRDGRVSAQRWTLGGIASFTLSRKRGLGCSDRNYVVFTDVTKYHDWIGKYR